MDTYQVSKCCGGEDCNWLGDLDDEPCWGQVVGTTTEDEDGFWLRVHVCQDHRDRYDMGASGSQAYYPVTTTV